KGYDEALRATPIAVSVDDITKELQQAYGSGRLSRDARSASFPQMKWVRRALEALVLAKLARRESEAGDYTGGFRVFRDDVLTRFHSLVGEGEATSESIDGAQLKLFHDDPSVADEGAVSA